MEENKTQTVEMTAEELARYNSFKEAEQKAAAKAKAKEEREVYTQLVDEEIESALPVLLEMSEGISSVKKKVLENFDQILTMKAEVLKRVKEDQGSHHFTHSDGKQRIIIGRHACDGWKDTVNDGVAIVKDACLDLINDDVTKALVNQMLRMISRDSAGNLKASKALQLRKMASDLNNERLNEGITIIEEAYIPSFSKVYIYAERKDDKSGAWVRVPLSMTEA